MSDDGAVAGKNAGGSQVSFMSAYAFVGVVNLVLWILAAFLIDRWLIVFGVLFAAMVMLGTMRAQKIIEITRRRKLEKVESMKFRKSKTRPLMRAVVEKNTAKEKLKNNK